MILDVEDLPFKKDPDPERHPIMAELWPRRERAYSQKNEWLGEDGEVGFTYQQIVRVQVPWQENRKDQLESAFEQLFDVLEIVVKSSRRELETGVSWARTHMAGLDEMGLSPEQAMLRMLRDPIVMKNDQDEHGIPLDYPAIEVVVECAVTPRQRVAA